MIEQDGLECSSFSIPSEEADAASCINKFGLPKIKVDKIIPISAQKM